MDKPREECIVCEKMIFRASRKGQFKQRRANSSITCSRQCARNLRRINAYLTNKIRRRLIKGEMIKSGKK